MIVPNVDEEGVGATEGFAAEIADIFARVAQFPVGVLLVFSQEDLPFIHWCGDLPLAFLFEI